MTGILARLGEETVVKVRPAPRGGAGTRSRPSPNIELDEVPGLLSGVEDVDPEDLSFMASFLLIS